MAKLAGDILFTGTLGELSAYKRHDSDNIIIRRKGGPSKKQIQSGKNFDILRRNMTEFAGRARGTWWLRQALQPLLLCGDTRVTGRINSLMKTIQEKDTAGKFGKRSILFSAYPSLFEGFNLNRYHSFDALVRNPLHYSIQKDTLSAAITLPALIPGVNFVTPFVHPYFRITAVLALLPDLQYGQPTYKPVGFTGSFPLVSTATTEWHPTVKGLDAQELSFSLSSTKIPATYTLALSVGICMGKPAEHANGIQQVKYAGAAKIAVIE